MTHLATATLLAALVTFAGAPIALAAPPAAPTAAPADPAAGPRTADEITAEYLSIRPPAFDESRQEDEAYLEQYMGERQKLLDRRNELAKELFDHHPDHPNALRMMAQRWMSIAESDYDTLDRETKAYLDATADSPMRQQVEMLRIQAALMRVQADPAHYPAAAAEADAFLKAHPDHQYAGPIQMSLAQANPDPEAQAADYRRIAEAYPGTQHGEEALAKIAALEAIGKPFELAFDDAVTGKRIDMADLKGKVVMIDFWATWCGPCVAEMPELKELYAKYKDRGVEFIGISLDAPEAEGGLKALKDFVAEHELPWPQYYQGNGWESAFSSKWQITAIPAQFIVDAEGNLRSTDVRGQLEGWFDKLLAEKAKPAEPAAAAE